MFDQLIGLLLVGLGLQSPVNGTVAGDTTQLAQAQGGLRTETKEIEALQGDVHRETRKLDTDLNTDRARGASEASREKNQDKRLLEEAILKRRQESQQIISEKRIAFQEEVNDRREQAKEEFAQKREEFKEQLEEISDARKKQIVENIDGRLSEINTKRTTRMSENLDKMTQIIGKVTERADALELEGVNTSSVDSAVATAESAIGSAGEAVAEQAGKEYVISINTDSTLKADVGSAMSALQTDLTSVHSQVVAAQKTVAAAILSVKQLIGEAQTNSVE